MISGFLVQIGLMVLPWPLRRRALNRIFGFRIHPSARIGASVVDARNFDMGEGCRIGYLNIFHGLEVLSIGDDSTVGNLNLVKGLRPGKTKSYGLETGRMSAFVMEPHTAVTHRHYIDCTDRVTMGAFSLMAGIGTRIFTHGINIVEGRQSCAPVSIGQYCQIGAGCILLKGTSLPDFSLLAVGSVLHKSYQQEYTLYSGVPAMPMRDVDRSARFFHRTKGRVD